MGGNIGGRTTPRPLNEPSIETILEQYPSREVVLEQEEKLQFLEVPTDMKPQSENFTLVGKMPGDDERYNTTVELVNKYFEQKGYEIKKIKMCDEGLSTSTSVSYKNDKDLNAHAHIWAVGGIVSSVTSIKTTVQKK